MISVLSLGLYKSEVWKLNKKQVARLEALYFKFFGLIEPNINAMSSFEEVITEAANCIIMPK